MKKVYLSICTLSLTFALSTNVNAVSTGSDATQLDQSYQHNNKDIKRDFNNNFNDPNHVMHNTKNTVKDDYIKTKNNIKNTSNDFLTPNNNGVNNTSNDGNYYRRNVTPTPVSNTLNTNNDNNHMNYGWLGLLGLLGFFGLRKKERVE
ncbi:WGxxGxxG family protein [Gottfriedia luciferensis]|uniref:WGxxGxxG family protein n=1 Tax=Gottfriedia luciferensis TaxID=178774 RepID=UPI001F15F677